MSTFWRRHKQRIIAATAVGVAGAAAAYYWWHSTEEQEQQRSRAWAQQRPAVAAAGPGGLADEKQRQQAALDDSLAQHFTSIQELSDRQALEELLPRLQQVVGQATDYEPLRDQLRSPAAAGLSSEEKLALWRSLACHSFCRALGSVWLVPLMDLLVRLKLHIVGRHMYLESKLPQLQPQGATPGGPHPALGGALRAANPYGRLALPPCLSDRAKEEFFRCDYFTGVGAGGLLHKLHCAVERSLAGVDFGGSMSQQDVESLVVTMHAAFEESFVRAEDLWAAYLVPPGPAPVSVRTGSGVEALLSPVEAAMVDELNAELRDTLSDYRFVEALRAAVRHTSKSMGAYISSKMGGGGALNNSEQQQQQQQQPGGAAVVRPFPYVVPIVAKSGNLLFDEAGRCTKGISQLRAVQALCASVFTFGPHIC
ncbi:Peroxin-3 [Scenedesmus sp. NREL 46B-D3]|nr:Peroxin-3 [Scenedesmus sp. NREL 46B-D3]